MIIGVFIYIPQLILTKLGRDSIDTKFFTAIGYHGDNSLATVAKGQKTAKLIYFNNLH